MKSRYLKRCVASDLAEKMVFVGGPRQVGKTTFALSMLPGDQDESSPAYLNWGVLEDRENILAARLPPGEKLVIFDEIHKYAKWRNLVKGLYDKNKSSVSFLVTGSAKLDYYRKGGDSLQGRYHYHRLHPFSATELMTGPDAATVEQLLTFGGFPEQHAHLLALTDHFGTQLAGLDLVLGVDPPCQGVLERAQEGSPTVVVDDDAVAKPDQDGVGRVAHIQAYV